ncbi:clathrin heavy chain linker domain-containing protein 1-like isoform X1 [Stegostoma tigrinum]|uniref:clathrin heavy chain linker domain-containing protein 1-like isoform X1 n=1 Tax=Stegostoma tigrinum TaxID=3053191 RepID=UPI00202B856F|nr:clathrin heavy chain linker domain-containing protein 1-like isoform X1 [Stegostoma tigrinum]
MAGEGPSTASLGKPQAISPIPTNRNLLCRIRTHVNTETGEVGCPDQGPDEQRYIIYRNVFDKVIENATAYKYILTSIKKEYEENINILRKGKEDSLFLQRKVKSMAFEPMTYLAYKKRATQLRNKIDLIKQNTAGLEAQLQAVRNSRHVQKEQTEETLPPQEDIFHITSIPGLTLQESTNVEDLCKHLRKLEKKLKDLKFAKETKYVPVQVKINIIQEINQKMQQWEVLDMVNKQLRLRYKRIQILADAVAAWGYSDKSVSLTEYILPSLTEAISLKEVGTLWPEILDADDPSAINEPAYLLEYVERFNKLFDDKQYKEAAIHVANCPRGILHNLEIMERFKAVTEYEGHISPLLQFFEAVMSSFSAVRHSPKAKMSLEGVECALKQNRLDLVIHWVIQQRVTCCEELGDLIYNYGDTELRRMDTCMGLAQIVYDKCNVPKKAALCMCMCGQISGAMAYIHDCKKFSLDDYLFLLNKCPNAELIQCLTHEWNGKPAVLSTGIAVLWLISNDHEETGFHLLKEICDSGQDAMQQTILNDVNCTLENWQEIADKCNTHNHNALADSIFTVLTSQEGGTVITITTEADNDGAKLIEHIFL